MNIFQAIAHTVHHWITAGDYAVATLGIMAATILVIGGALTILVTEEK